MTVNITTCILIIFRTKPDVKQNVEESTVKNMKFVEITNQKENNYEILPNPFHTPCATAANREGRYVGVTDTPLSQEGIGKLEDMNRRYSYPGAPVFYVSPLKRCVETCKIIYPQVTPILVPALSECNFGEWEGKTAEELKEDPKFQQCWKTVKRPRLQVGKAGKTLPSGF